MATNAVCRRFTCLCWTTWLGTAILALGCADKDGSFTAYPVSGQVFYQGKPTAGAKVLFFFASENLRGQRIPTPQATVDAEGNFQLGCYNKTDGAPAGEYKVAIVWQEGSFDPEGPEPPDLLKGRYAYPQSSGLTATVVGGKNKLPPFQLE